MKKFLISILVIILMIFTYFLLLKNITIGQWKSSNIKNIKDLNSKLNKQVDIATQINNQEYLSTIENLENSIKELKVTKEKYQSKTQYIEENIELGTTTLKEYKIERLWITFEKYAKRENVELKLDLLDTGTPNVYDMNITLIGEYIGITDFIYDVEKDDTLGFKILNFKLLPNASVQTTTTSNVGENSEIDNDGKTEDKPNIDKYTANTTTIVDTNKLRATFTIEDVGIEFN